MMNLASLMVLATIMSSSLAIALADPVKEAAERNCVDQVVEYLAQHSVPGPVQELVRKSRKFYPDFTVLFGKDPVKFGYESALVKFVKGKPSWDECAQVVKVIDVMGARVPCYRELKVKIENVVRTTESQAAKDVVEADYVCQMAYL